MITDSIYVIGNNHLVCQDYALNGTKEGPSQLGYGIVSDGCSSSPDVDVGARMLALHYRSGVSLSDRSEYWQYGLPVSAYRKSRESLAGTGLSTACLDATLLSVVQTETEVSFSVFGDGYVLFVEKGDPTRLRVRRYEYTDNTPYYLSLEHGDAVTQREFRGLPQKLETTMFTFEANGDSTEYTEVHPSITRPRFSLPTEDILFAGVASDGWGSFYHRDSHTPLSVETVFQEFHEFPVISDGFLKRRVSKMLQGFDKQGFRHFDDLSMAVIHNGEA